MREYLVVDEEFRAYGFLKIEAESRGFPDLHFAYRNGNGFFKQATLKRCVVYSRRPREGSDAFEAIAFQASDEGAKGALLWLRRDVFETVAERYTQAVVINRGSGGPVDGRHALGSKGRVGCGR